MNMKISDAYIRTFECGEIIGQLHFKDGKIYTISINGVDVYNKPQEIMYLNFKQNTLSKHILLLHDLQSVISEFLKQLQEKQE